VWGAATKAAMAIGTVSAGGAVGGDRCEAGRERLYTRGMSRVIAAECRRRVRLESRMRLIAACPVRGGAP